MLFSRVGFYFWNQFFSVCVKNQNRDANGQKQRFVIIQIRPTTHKYYGEYVLPRNHIIAIRRSKINP